MSRAAASCGRGAPCASRLAEKSRRLRARREITMKSIKRMAAQGDVVFRRVKAVPVGFALQPEAPRTIVAHSETGHHHAIDSTGVRLYEGSDPLVCYLRLESVEFADVVHHRGYDTHETVRLLGGVGSVFEIRRQREYTPEGWRRVED